LKVGGKKNELWERLKERVMMTQGATQNNNAKKPKTAKVKTEIKEEDEW
jgi:hypothetical protein